MRSTAFYTSLSILVRFISRERMDAKRGSEWFSEGAEQRKGTLAKAVELSPSFPPSSAATFHLLDDCYRSGRELT